MWCGWLGRRPHVSIELPWGAWRWPWHGRCWGGVDCGDGVVLAVLGYCVGVVGVVGVDGKQLESVLPWCVLVLVSTARGGRVGVGGFLASRAWCCAARSLVNASVCDPWLCCLSHGRSSCFDVPGPEPWVVENRGNGWCRSLVGQHGRLPILRVMCGSEVVG